MCLSDSALFFVGWKCLSRHWIYGWDTPRFVIGIVRINTLNCHVGVISGRCMRYDRNKSETDCVNIPLLYQLLL